MIVKNQKQIGIEAVALILIVYGNMCFYKLDTQFIYILMNAIAGILVILKHIHRRIAITKTVMWITAVFLIFISYGVLFLRTGMFNADRFVIAYYQCILYYIIFKSIIRQPEYEKRIAVAFAITSSLCILTMYINEGDFLGRELRSVGSTMSGNVNTVGMGLGIMSMFLMFYYGKARKPIILILALAVMAVMMLTGSKKTVVYIIANIFILYSFSKNKTNGKVVLIILASILAYVIFGVDYFYNMLGSRIIDMLGQFGIHLSNAHYSHSTEARIFMIKEGFEFWLRNPIFGGGTNYFQANTITLYEYSHCNVTELLCSFGLFGFIIYYLPYITFYKHFKSIKNTDYHLAYFCLIIIVVSLVIDWMAITFSSFSTVYIPVIFTLVVREWVKEQEAIGILSPIDYGV